MVSPSNTTPQFFGSLKSLLAYPHVVILNLANNDFGEIDEDVAGLGFELSRLLVNNAEAAQTVTAAGHQWGTCIEPDEGLTRHQGIVHEPARSIEMKPRPVTQTLLSSLNAPCMA